ncbi:hypothetical protein [Methanohalobium sp.]|uniref:hypothetical protein n=1 Tax=Methanohalobium sp. TaxID=2837493 RepID=UPI0025F2F7BA|nr:hypothetical protein [Methanohalobium sp.]
MGTVQTGMLFFMIAFAILFGLLMLNNIPSMENQVLLPNLVGLLIVAGFLIAGIYNLFTGKYS